MLHIYNASAGSGKTYVLVKEFLKLTLTEPQNIKNIVAMTFTNQATNNIKTKILNNLSDMTINTNTPLAIDLQKDLSLTTDQIKQYSNKLLEFILEHFDYFGISTIDSFLQSIVKSFIYELGINYAYTISIDTNNASQFAVDYVLNKKAPNNPELLQWLYTYIKSKIKYNKSSNIRTAIEDYTKILCQEPRITKDIFPLSQSIDTYMDNFEKTMFQLAQHILDLTGDDNFKYGRNGAISYPHKIVEKHDYEPTKRFLSTYINPKLYLKNSIPNEEEVSTALIKLFKYYSQYGVKYNTYKAITSTMYLYGITQELLEGLKEFKFRNNTILISDVVSMILQIVQDNDTHFIYEKAGTYYNHFLIDEFQDISISQWKSIKPLIDNAIAQGYRNIIVGDVKQSIYRWRGSDSCLLLDLINNNPQTTHNLTTNWRSHKNIVEFNNKIFHSLCQQVSEYLHNLITPLGSTSLQNHLTYMSAMYSNIHQTCNSKEKGIVTEVYVNDERSIIPQVIKEIEQLQDCGSSLSDITILVRTNIEGQVVIDALREQNKNGKYRYNVTSESMSMLSNSIPVKLIISVFQSLVNKSELLFYELVNYYRVYHHCTDDIFSLADQIRGKLSLLPPLTTIRQYILEIIDIFDVDYDDYVCCFIDNVNNCGDIISIYSFIHWWETNGSLIKVEFCNNTDSIKVMTIHQSKGLEFKNVIIPFELHFDEKLNHSDLNWYIYEGYDIPVRYSKNIINTEFIELYYSEHIMRCYDNLNTIYVAYTRAIDYMILIKLAE